MRQRCADFQAGLVGDERDLLVGLDAQAAHDGVARSRRELRIDRHRRANRRLTAPLRPSQATGADDPDLRFVDHVVHYFFQIAGLVEDAQLAVRAGAFFQDPVDVADLLAAAEFVHHVVDELQDLADQVAHRHLRLLAEIDHLAVEAVARGAPLVLHDQRRGCNGGRSGCARASWYSLAMMAWHSAAMAMVSSSRIGMSQMRNSSVGKCGCGRMSHQIFLALSMQLVRISRLT